MAELTQPQVIWMDGGVRPWGDAHVHVWSEVVLRAASVFEGLRGYWIPAESRHYFVHVADHFRRLAESAKLIHIPMSLSVNDITHGLTELVSTLGYQEDIYARPTLFLKKGRYTNETSEADTGFFMPVFQSAREKSIEFGLRCIVSSWRRTGDESAPPRVKAAANYYNFRLARLEAEAYGFDEAILLNHAGKVAETGGASIFLVRNGRVATPRLSDSILESITRQSAMELLEGVFSIPVEAREIDRTELYVADEIFLSGTLCEITPVTFVDQTKIGRGIPGKLTRQLQQEYYGACHAGASDRRGWLTPGPIIL
ncbi:aminotransferase class IV [Nocardia aurea]|uniref:aminotransferase class IV n=1 Tax=Nocardia aurea TaxID=2144174 RepID=UPI000D69B08D|nr:aminotransferase class IV [Nocardia aurea]